ncbi:hypothetical protein Bca101_012344 [Brassica carinata]
MGPSRYPSVSMVIPFDCCFESHVMGEDECKLYVDTIVAQLHDLYPDASFKVFNFRARDQQSQISTVLSQYGVLVLDYPSKHEGVPLLPLQMISQFLVSSESWLGQPNVMLMHCERGSLPLLDFMLSALLLNIKRYHGDQKTLELAYNQANSIELIRLASPLNPQSSQLRYLGYISTRYLGFDWPPPESLLFLDCLVLRGLPSFEGRKDWRPSLRVFGQDPSAGPNSSFILVFSTPKTNRINQQEECLMVMLDIRCRVKGDVVLEFIHLHDDLVNEDMVFRIMFNTGFVRGNVLMAHRDEMDILWDAKKQVPKEFNAEVPSIARAPLMREKEPLLLGSLMRARAPPPPPPPPMHEGRGRSLPRQVLSSFMEPFHRAPPGSLWDWFDIRRTTPLKAEARS